MTPWWRRPAGDDDAADTADNDRNQRGDLGRTSGSEPEPETSSPEAKRGKARVEEEAEGPAHIEDTLAVGESDAAEESEEDAVEEGEEREPSRPRRRRSRRRSSSGGAAQETKGEEEPEKEARQPARRRVPAARPAANASRSRGNGGGGATAADDTSDLGDLVREFLNAVPERVLESADERKIALFCDLENIAIGVRDSDIKKFDVNLVLERLLEKGKIIVKKAYADWERYGEYKRAFHAAAIEMIDIPQKYYSGKNSADIKMVVDAMDLCYSKEHLDTFVILSGDSDFSPLVSKLKENNKYVIGCGVKKSSSNLLIDNCDEFIYYEDVWRNAQQGPLLDGLSEQQTEAFGLMVDAIQALQRENKDVLWGSMIKQTMQRKRPSFNEGYYGYDSFSELLEDAQKTGILKLKKDRRSGSYIVVGFANPRR